MAAAQQLFAKLAHELPEVRRRALRSLQFKLEQGLLGAGDLTAAAPALVAALDLLCDGGGEPAEDARAVLALVHVLATQPGSAEALLRQAADQALIRLADAAPACSHAATTLLGELLVQRGGGPPAPDPGSATAAAAVAAAAWVLQSQPPFAATSAASQPISPPGRWCASSVAPSPALPALPWTPGMPSTPTASRAAALPDPLAACSARVRAVQLSAEDEQQLFELALELGAEGSEDAAALAVLTTLRHGVLADMPPAAVAGEPAVMEALLRLLDGSRRRPAAAAATLQILAVLARGLAGAEVAGEGEAGLAVAPLAHAALLRCVTLCADDSLCHEALPAAAALVPLLAPAAGAAPGERCAAARALAPLLQALTDVLRLSLVAGCTGADVAPPSEWQNGFHTLALGIDSCGLLRLVAELAGHMPEVVQALPPELCDILAALACNPAAAAAAPALHAFALRWLPELRPAAAAQLQAVAGLRRQQDDLLAAVGQLAGATSAALAAACFREVQQQLAALHLLPEGLVHQVVGSIMAAAWRHCAAPAAAHVAAALLQQEAGTRQAALEAACQLQAGGADGTLLVHPAVVGSLVLSLGDEPPRQKLAAQLLQAAAASAPSGACSEALLSWEAWLLAHAEDPAVGPAVAAALQAAAAHKRSTWQRLAPVAQSLFHASPAVASAAAAQLHSLLAQLQPAAAATMLFNPLPFDGLVAPVGSVTPSMAGPGWSPAAANLFSAADVQSLLAVVANPALSPELVAAALGQLAQVAGDARFGVLLMGDAVLASLVSHALHASPLHSVQQPALSCLVALLEAQPAAADWLLADPDARVVPLLPLAFHPLAAARQGAAKLLHHVLFAAAARLPHSLPATAATGIGSSSNGSAPVAACPGSLPLPFCTLYRFPYPAAALPVWPAAASQRQGSSVFGGSEQVQRLWRAQQVCAAAGESSGGGLLQLLAVPSAMPRWEQELVRASLATLRGLQPEAQAAAGLRSLTASQDHWHCHAALRGLKLLATALPEGLPALAAAAWPEALRFLVSAAPLSDEDCRLWLEMLPLLQQLLPAGAAAAAPGDASPLLQQLTDQFAGGSALAWMRGQSDKALRTPTGAALLPVVLHMVQQVAELAALSTSSSQRAALTEALRTRDWLALLCQQLQVEGSYAGRVAILQLAGVLLALLRGRGSSLDEAAPLLSAAMRHVLMPRHLWGTQHRHGKAAVLAALQAVLTMTRAVPAAEWAAAWAGVGTTYWLSRAVDDSSPAVRASALHLLSAALAAAPTHQLLQQAWPECAVAAVGAALDADQPAEVQEAALLAIAAALSHGPSELAADPAAAASAEEADAGAGSGEGGSGSGACAHAASPGDVQLALLPPAPSPLAVEALLQQEELWAHIGSMLQEATDPGLMRAAAHAALQFALLDAEGACKHGLVTSSVLLRLLRAPAASAGVLLGREAAGSGSAAAAVQAVQAARAAATMLAAAVQLVPGGTLMDGAASTSVLSSAIAAFSNIVAVSQADLGGLPELEARELRQQCRAALPPLADAVALLLLRHADTLPAEQLQHACTCEPLPLAAAIARALARQPAGADSSSASLCAAGCRLLAALLQRQETAAAFLQAPGGTVHMVSSGEGSCSGQPAGASLCLLLVEQYVAAAGATAAEHKGAAAEESAAQKLPPLLMLHAALGGLVAHSREAKEAALQIGLHTSLLSSCSALAPACAAAPKQAAAAAPPQPQADAAARTRLSKLSDLKLQRQRSRSGGGAAPAPPVHLAFGRRMSVPSGQQGSSSTAPQMEETACQAEPSCPASGTHQPGGKQQQQWCLVQLLGLLQALVSGHPAASEALVAAGVMEAACTLWGCGADVQLCLLHLLGALLACQPARHACATTGEPSLLERLLGLVLSGRGQLATAAGTTLACFAASPDGSHTLIHACNLPPQALALVQDCGAAKDWRRCLPLLSLLSHLGSQPEGQRAVLRCAAPSGDLFPALLQLASQHHGLGSDSAAAAAMAVVRQVFRHPEAKPLAIKHGAVQQLADAVAAAGAQPALAAEAARALWALASGSGSERAKAGLRGCGLSGALDAALAVCRRDDAATWAPALRQACEALQRLLA